MAFVAGLLALPLVLAGCSSDDPEPKIAPPEISAPTVSESPTATATEKPVEDSPEDIVRAWVAARNQALNDGVTGPVQALSSASCRSCKGLIAPIEDIYDAGGHFETTGWRVVKAKQKQANVSRPVVNTALAFAGGSTVSTKGGEANLYPPEKHIVVFKLVRQSGGWSVDFVGFLS